MSAIGPAVAYLAAEIARLSAGLGRAVTVDEVQVGDRRGDLELKRPGVWSPNRSCRMVQAADGWIAVNLPRDDDRSLLSAWLQADVGSDPWRAILAVAGGRSWRRLVDEARLLGLPVAGVGEVEAGPIDTPLKPMSNARPTAAAVDAIKVIDLSSLWAGPLCGSILAAMGATVTKVESAGRPDPSRTATPGLFARLNGGKADVQADFADRGALARLADDMVAADVVITSARPRAFEQLGLSPATLFKANPRLVWVAISGYGWTGDEADRVAFGDDAAAAGGLVRWTPAGAPHFIGDALADPVTGLAAAAGALRGLTEGGGVLVDAALARCAAGAAALTSKRAA